MPVRGIIIKNIATFKRNCKYNKTTAGRLVSLIDSYDLSVIDFIIDRFWQILLYLQLLKNVAIYLIILNLIAKFATIPL